MWYGQIPGLDSTWGNSLYNASGANASAKQQYKNQLKLQKDAQEFSKWQMANAHQMEVQDLQNAGLNPVLSAGGSGASAGVTEGSASAGSPVIDPISAVGQIIGMINSSKQTKSTVENMNADSELKNAEAYKTWITSNPEAKKLEKEYDALIQNINESKSREELNEAQKGLAEWESRHPVASKILGGAVSGAAAIGASAITARALQLGVKTRVNSAKTTTKHMYNSKGNLTGSTVTTTR